MKIEQLKTPDTDQIERLTKLLEGHRIEMERLFYGSIVNFRVTDSHVILTEVVPVPIPPPPQP